MGFIRFLSTLFKPSVRNSSITDSTVGVAGDHSAIENLYIFQNPHHLTNQKDLESEIRQYCQKADSFHSLIPLAGFKTRVKVPIDLDQIYVPLRAVMDTRTTGQSCFGGAEEADCFFKERGEGLEIPLTEAFKEAEKANRTGIIILGDPGSGKTTHLKRLLLWCLRGNLEKMGLPRDMIPVFLPLRELKIGQKG